MNASARRRFLAPSLLLAAALTGCGGSSQSSGNAPTAKLDACTLFTYEDAEAVAGESLAPWPAPSMTRWAAILPNASTTAARRPGRASSAC